MARIARVVIPDAPHHVIQRGNRRQRTFFSDADYRAYLLLLKKWAQACSVRILVYCLMPNHTHSIAVPREKDSLARAFGGCHERYTRMVNAREGWTGYLWQGRFKSHPMDERHLLNAVRYVLQNPVKAGLVSRVEDWPFSSARSILSGASDPLSDIRDLPYRTGGWRDSLEAPLDEETCRKFERHLSTGRPFGDESYLRALEAKTGRSLIPKRRGPKPKKR